MPLAVIGIGLTLTHISVARQQPDLLGRVPSQQPGQQSVRFATTVANGHATLAAKQDAALYLSWTCTGWIAPALPGGWFITRSRWNSRPIHEDFRTFRNRFATSPRTRKRLSMCCSRIPNGGSHGRGV